MNRLNKTESAVFVYGRFSVFLKDPFFQIIYSIINAFRISLMIISFFSENAF